MDPYFRPAALKFLKDLARHNDRVWFNDRKDIYETEVKAPMLAFIEAVNGELACFAPDFVRDPARCMMRIYRDIRFSSDKRPYKTQAAAWWARHGLEKTSGAGFYFDLSPEGVTVAAGVYMPAPDQLLAIRRMLLDRYEEFRELTSVKKMRGLMEPFDGLRLSRAPKGFPTDHPALDLILPRQWGMATRLPAETALSSGLLKATISRLKLTTPMVEFLNRPLVPSAPKPLF